MNNTSAETRSDRGGLTAPEVERLRATHGWNEIVRGKSLSPINVLARQFRGLLVLILIAAAVAALLVGETVDAVAIALVIFLNAALGFVQEWRAETALAALRNMMAPMAVAVRDGRETQLPARELVPGDLVLLDAGDTVPADLSLVYSAQLKLDESVLTGESLPVAKSHLDEAPRMFSGTNVVQGRAEGVVQAIGANTEFGNIAEMTRTAGQAETHIQRKLATLAKQLGAAAVLIATAITLIGVAVGRSTPEMLMTGLSLAVALVPEGLPAVVTITLALGASAMARQNALARRLQAVETLGAATVICTDKTGTLTENKMTATNLWMVDAEYEVTGTGYDPRGHIARNGARIRAADDPALAELLDAGLNCNHASLSREAGEWVMTGDPTEGALLVLAHKGWLGVPGNQTIINELPFSSEEKWMCVVTARGTHSIALAKGAPEAMLARCDSIRTADGVKALTSAIRASVLSAYDDMANRGLRVMALARQDVSDSNLPTEGFVFLGLVGIIDPPRPEVGGAVSLALAAGIRVIMVTGDGPVTARAIARQLNIPAKHALSGDEMATMSDDDLTKALTGDFLFARVHPGDKLRIVKSLQDSEHVVAMTGDGVNDAPALKQADIGVAMGVRGSAVAKDASDLILLDDNFSTIVDAIREGRRQFENIRKFVSYLLSSNAGEVVAIVINIMIGGPLIFLATQILWMNLITDGVTAVSLGLEKSERSQMDRAPQSSDAAILGPKGFGVIAVLGTYTGLASLWIFYTVLPQGEALARTTAFTAMVVFEKLSVFAFRSLSQPCWKIGWFSNRFLLVALALTLSAQVAAVYVPFLQVMLHTVPLSGQEWQLILGFAVPIVLVPELVKSFR